jgi:hypothetical protein
VSAQARARTPNHPDFASRHRRFAMPGVFQINNPRLDLRAALAARSRPTPLPVLAERRPPTVDSAAIITGCQRARAARGKSALSYFKSVFCITFCSLVGESLRNCEGFGFRPRGHAPDTIPTTLSVCGSGYSAVERDWSSEVPGQASTVAPIDQSHDC